MSLRWEIGVAELSGQDDKKFFNLNFGHKSINNLGQEKSLRVVTARPIFKQTHLSTLKHFRNRILKWDFFR